MIPRAATPADRLRLLRDCGVFRSSMGDKGLTELCRLGLAQRRIVPGRPKGRNLADRCDYLLTGQGRIVASRLGPFA